MASAIRKPGQAQYATLDQQDFSYNPGLPQDRHHGGRETFKPQPTISGGKRAIYLALACILIPMLGLSAILIGLVYGYQIERYSTMVRPLVLLQQSDLDDSAYYVRINSTTFATIASWSSTIAPLLIMAAMSLASFPVARSLKNKSSVETSDLPTPFQLSLLLESLNGSIMSVWRLMRYRRWPHKQPVASVVRSAFVILVVASVVGYAVAGIDTWLHLVMDTVEIDIKSTELSTQRQFGRGIDPDLGCTNQTAADFDVQECTVSLAVTGTFLEGANVAYKTLGNLSTEHTVGRAKYAGKTLAYLGPADAEVPPQFDYQANTLAMHTECTPVAAKCNLHVESGASEPFHCSSGFFGDLPSRNINGDTTDQASGLNLLNQNTGIVFYEDEDLTKYANKSFSTRTQNPYYMGVWAYLFGLTADSNVTRDGNIVVPMHGGVTWLLSCTATAYEMTYSSVSSNITVNDLQQANGTIGTIINSPTYYGFGKASMESSAYSATAQENAPGVAEAYGYAYSRTSMALVSGIMTGRPTIVQQQRESILVSRIPKLPLYFLVAVNCIYGILGIVLALLALSTSPSETNDIREKLSIAGMVATNFEGVRARRPAESRKEMFAEHSGESSARVGIERSVYEGWEYTLRNNQKQLS